MKQSELIRERLRNVMTTDRTANVDKLITVIKSDMLNLLRSYMYIDINDINLEIDAGADGIYILRMAARTDCIIDPGKILE